MIAGVLRVKNEERFLARCLRSLDFCEAIYLLDDGSTDRTPEIARNFRNVEYTSSPWNTLDEVRDRTFLLDIARAAGAEWVVCLDGDEELTPEAAARIQRCDYDGLELRVYYLWDGEEQVRTDGVYGRFYAKRAFHLDPQAKLEYPRLNTSGFHCGSVPKGIAPIRRAQEIVLHWGYFDAGLRAAKYAFYQAHDPGNRAEDFYRHIIQGDPSGEPATARLRHAGPLTLESIRRTVAVAG